MQKSVFNFIQYSAAAEFGSRSPVHLGNVHDVPAELPLLLCPPGPGRGRATFVPDLFFGLLLFAWCSLGPCSWTCHTASRLESAISVAYQDFGSDKWRKRNDKNRKVPSQRASAAWNWLMLWDWSRLQTGPELERRRRPNLTVLTLLVTWGPSLGHTVCDFLWGHRTAAHPRNGLRRHDIEHAVWPGLATCGASLNAGCWDSSFTAAMNVSTKVPWNFPEMTGKLFSSEGPRLGRPARTGGRAWTIR